MVDAWHCLLIALSLALLHSARSALLPSIHSSNPKNTVYRDGKLMAYEPSAWDELALVGEDAVKGGLVVGTGGIFGAFTAFVGFVNGLVVGTVTGGFTVAYCHRQCWTIHSYYCKRSDGTSEGLCCKQNFLLSCYGNWAQVEADYPIPTIPTTAPPTTPPPVRAIVLQPDWNERTRSTFEKPVTTKFTCKRGSKNPNEVINAGSNKCNFQSNQCFLMKCVTNRYSNPFYQNALDVVREWGCVPEGDTDFCNQFSSNCCCQMTNKNVQMGNELLTNCEEKKTKP